MKEELSKFKYIVCIDVNTDGDFTYDKRKESNILCENWDQSCLALRSHIENLIETISGRDYTVEDIKEELGIFLEDKEIFPDMLDEPNYTQELYWGNQEASFSIKPVTFLESEHGLVLGYDRYY